MQFLKITIIFLMGTWSLFADLSIQNIEKMVNDIRTKRTSKATGSVPSVSPFIVVRQDENRSVISSVSERKIKTNFFLGAVVNSSAFIDGEWKKRGDTVGDFHVDAVAEDHVVLKMKNRTITLYFRKTKNILKIGKE